MELDKQLHFPTFEGNTGGWLRSAEVEEKYAITWTKPKKPSIRNANRWNSFYAYWRKFSLLF